MKILNKDFICKISLSIFSVLFFFIVLETSTRIWLYFKNLKSFDQVMHNLPELKPDVLPSFAQMIQPSKYPDIIYELRPNIKTTYINFPVETNSHGWRGKLCPIEKDADTIRIVMIGDSHMFGWGVPEDKRYSNVLESMLNSKFPRKKWQVINTGVPGYNTYMEVETLKRKALMYKPDIVIMQYIGNDLDLPDFILNVPSYFSLTHSYLWDIFKGRVSKCDLVASPSFRDVLTGGMRYCGADNASLVPEKYRHMVGWRGFVEAMMNLKRMQSEQDFDVVILVSHDYPPTIGPKMKELFTQLGFFYLFRQQLIEPVELVLSKNDGHPSVLGHVLTAYDLFDFLSKENIIKKCCEKI